VSGITFTGSQLKTNPPLQALKRKQQGLSSAQMRIQNTSAASYKPDMSKRDVKLNEGGSKTGGVVLGGEAQKENDANLMRIWPKMVEILQGLGVVFGPDRAPQDPTEVRIWLKTHPKEIGLITHLSLSGLGLTAIPKELLEMPLKGLKMLSLGNNAIKQIPLGFGKNFHNLRQLFLCMNELKALPRDFGLFWLDLNYLDLSFNQIAFLPPAFIHYWPKLESLLLGHNRLNGLLGGFTDNWKHLKKLCLKDNQIEWLPKGFSDLKLRMPFSVAEVFAGNPMLERIHKADVTLSKSMSAQKLYEGAKRHAMWEAVIEKPSNAFRAVCNYVKGLIVLDPDVSDLEMTSMLLFELTNAASMDKMAQIKLSAFSGKIDRETYAKEIERIEHQGALLHKKIVAEGIATLQWDPKMDIYQLVDEDFEVYWQKIKDTAHPEEYRKYWDESIKPKLVGSST
jgi:Leucine-rich repeat (LRR) protein